MQKKPTVKKTKKKSKPTSRTTSSEFPKNRREVPATTGLVLDVRNELKADISALGYKMNQRFMHVDVQFKTVDARLITLEAQIEGVKSTVEEVKSSVHRIEALAEEQRSENRIMLEGLMLQNQRLEQLNGRVERVETSVGSLGHLRRIEE